MPSPTLASINGAAFERQGVPFLRTLDTSSELDEEESIIATLEPKQRLSSLSETRQRVVKIVRKFPGIDAKTLGGILGISRYAALAHLKSLANPDKNVLQSEEGNKPKSGAKATLYFFLAEDISAELVDVVLGAGAVESNLDMDAGNSQPLKPRTRPGKKVIYDSSDPASSFANMLPPTQELAIAIAKAGDKGSTVNELESSTGQKTKRLYERLKFLMERELASRKTLPGFRNRYAYIATSTLKTIVEQLPQEQTDLHQATPSSNVDTCDQPLSRTMTVQSSEPSSIQTPEDTLSQLQQDNQEIFEVMAEMAKKLKELENRFESLESALRSKRTLKSADIRAILNSNPKPLS
ncbi:hypothetical protein H6F90_25765 [Trichocoleus sp. FACHB-591]|uniref:hypothetical protein n=1 Tax=Trichocoleus sp. FACHB-591 TaxID=2692872 RepID=UPI0016856F08|nr:hypothetical protein [Trichocoleus sp. FACHB-591]MBD2098482.1 hypothetical protein [Trichocoleus sp. FACHB-591]